MTEVTDSKSDFLRNLEYLHQEIENRRIVQNELKRLRELPYKQQKRLLARLSLKIPKTVMEINYKRYLTKLVSNQESITTYRPLKLPDGENNGSSDVLITNYLYFLIPFAIWVIFSIRFTKFAMKKQRREQNQRQLIVENEHQRVSNNTPEILLPRITNQHSRMFHGERVSARTTIQPSRMLHDEMVSARIPRVSRELWVNVPEEREPEVSGRTSVPPEFDRASLPPSYEEPPPYHSLHF